MKKRIFFRPLDIIIYFNLFIFVGAGITEIKEQLSFSIVFFIVSLVNVFYLVQNIRNRIKIENLNEKTIELELEVEKTLKEEENIDLNLIKQKVLENRIESEIKENFKEAKIIKNAYIPKNDGNFTEIDLIAITYKGIFVIESKNVTGSVEGNWGDDFLNILHPGGETFEMFNPIIQNGLHYRALKNILGLNNKLFRNIVVFGDKAFIDNFKNIPPFARVTKVDNLTYSMNILSNKYKHTLEDYQINNIYETIYPFVKETEEKRESHINRLEQNKENEETY